MASVCKDGWEYDWESMTNAEFARFAESLQSSTKGVPASRFATMEEYDAFKERHGRYLVFVFCKPISADVEADVIPLDLPSFMEEEAEDVNEGKLKRVRRE